MGITGSKTIYGFDSSRELDLYVANRTCLVISIVNECRLHPWRFRNAIQLNSKRRSCLKGIVSYELMLSSVAEGSVEAADESFSFFTTTAIV